MQTRKYNLEAYFPIRNLDFCVMLSWFANLTYTQGTWQNRLTFTILCTL